MTYAVPKTKESELLVKLEKLFECDEVPGEFVLAGLARDANKLMHVDAASGHIVLAGLAALRWDVQDVENHCKQALAFERSPPMLMNAAVNLRNVCLIQEAAAHVRDAAYMDPANLHAQRDAIDTLYSAGQLQECLALLRRNIERGMPYEASEEASLLETIAALESLGVNEEEVVAELNVTYAVLYELHYRPRGFSVQIALSPDWGKSVHFGVAVYGDHTDEIRVETVLADRLANLPRWDPSRFSVQIFGEQNDADNPQ